MEGGPKFGEKGGEQAAPLSVEYMRPKPLAVSRIFLYSYSHRLEGGIQPARVYTHSSVHLNPTESNSTYFQTVCSSTGSQCQSSTLFSVFKMALVNMDSPIFYTPPIKADSRRSRSTSVANSLNTSRQGDRGRPVSQTAGEVQSLNPVSSSWSEPLGSTKSNGETKSWDSTISFSSREDDNRSQSPGSSHVLGISKIGVSDEPAVGETVGE